MALTRKFLSALGIDADKIDEIITAHTDTVNALKEQLKTAEANAEKVKEVQKELDDYKKDLKDKYRTKEDYDKLSKEFNDYKADVTGKEAAAAKEKAVRAYFEGKGIKGANLEIAIKGSRDEINGIDLDGEKIKDTKVLDELIGGTFAGLVSKQASRGAKTDNPPENGGNGTVKTKADIMKIKDAGERQKAIAENIELFRPTARS